jgi:nucleotide-binding universal stress UspA family protein
MKRPIIVLLGDPPGASSAPLVHVAQTLAGVWGSMLHFVNASNGSRTPRSLLDELEPFELHDYVLHEQTGDPISAIGRAAGGHPHATVIAFSTESGPASHPVLSQLAERVLLENRSPAIFVRPGLLERPWEIRSVLVPHDGTPTTTAALRPAAELTLRVAGWLTVVHVADAGVPPPDEVGSMAAPRLVDQPQHEWPAWGHEFADRLMAICTIDPSRLRLTVRNGNAEDAILHSASESAADLLVLAWHGTSAGEHGRIVRDLLPSAPCPVMVIRAERRHEVHADRHAA